MYGREGTEAGRLERWVTRPNSESLDNHAKFTALHSGEILKRILLKITF